MNPQPFQSTYPRALSWALLAGLLVWPLTGRGQNAAPTSRREAFATSAALFAAQDVDNAEKALFATNSRQPGTAGWHMESAGALVAMAFQFRGQGQIAESVFIARRALIQLSLAQTKLTPSDGAELAAAVQMLAGVINERLAGDTNVARQFYRAAAQLDPKSPAAAAADRLDKADAEVTKKQGRK